jgi:hypothetical protein
VHPAEPSRCHPAAEGRRKAEGTDRRTQPQLGPLFLFLFNVRHAGTDLSSLSLRLPTTLPPLYTAHAHHPQPTKRRQPIDQPNMCDGPDLFLCVLAILFPPIAGTYRHHGASRLQLYSIQRTTTDEEYSMGQARHLRCGLPHKHCSVLSRLSARIATRLGKFIATHYPSPSHHSTIQTTALTGGTVHRIRLPRPWL